MSEYQKQVGWQLVKGKGLLGSEAKLVAVFKPPEGAITTRAFIRCCDCSRAICTIGGPRAHCYCFECAKKLGR